MSWGRTRFSAFLTRTAAPEGQVWASGIAAARETVVRDPLGSSPFGSGHTLLSPHHCVFFYGNHHSCPKAALPRLSRSRRSLYLKRAVFAKCDMPIARSACTL